MAIFLEERKVELTLTTEMLGTVPKNKDLYSDFIVEKAIKKGIEVDREEELETVEEMDEKGFTGFHYNDKGIFTFDYLVKGNIKSNIGTLIEGNVINKIPAYKKAVDNMVFIFPRHLLWTFKKKPILKSHGIMERPLRVMTMQGPRTSLAKSEYLDIGSTTIFTIKILSSQKITWKIIEKAFDYGKFIGLGQWRGSGGYGRYTWKYVYRQG